HASIAELASAMDAGQVDTLVILGGNPVFSAPADLKFGEKMQKVGFIAYHGLYVDETAHLSHWNLPAAHDLESWGDARAYGGTGAAPRSSRTTGRAPTRPDRGRSSRPMASSSRTRMRSGAAPFMTDSSRAQP